MVPSSFVKHRNESSFKQNWVSYPMILWINCDLLYVSTHQMSASWCQYQLAMIVIAKMMPPYYIYSVFSALEKNQKTISSNIYLIIHMRFWIQNVYWFENSSILSDMFLLKTENSLLSFKSMVYLAIQTDGKLSFLSKIHFIHFNSCWNQMEQSSFKQ